MALDYTPTTGIDFDEQSSRWVRAVSSRHRGLLADEILEYKGRDAVVIGSILDPHDVLVTGSRTFVVDTWNNAIRAFDGMSRWSNVLSLPGEPDSWHLNGIEAVGEDLFATAFHRGGTFRQWSGNVGGGVLFSTTSGRVLAGGLSSPHSPRFIDGGWYVCNSATGELFLIDSEDASRRSVAIDCGGFTRGLAFDGSYLYVGVSTPRGMSILDPSAGASLVIIDRGTWTITDRLPVPVPEIYDVRVVASGSHRLLHEMTGVQEAGDLRESGSRGAIVDGPGLPTGLGVTFDPPSSMRPGEVVIVPAAIHHRGSEYFSTIGSSRASLSYSWLGSFEGSVLTVGTDEALRSALPGVIEARTVTPVDLIVRAPAVPGVYGLRCVLVQEDGEGHVGSHSFREVSVAVM